MNKIHQILRVFIYITSILFLIFFVWQILLILVITFRQTQICKNHVNNVEQYRYGKMFSDAFQQFEFDKGYFPDSIFELTTPVSYLEKVNNDERLATPSFWWGDDNQPEGRHGLLISFGNGTVVKDNINNGFWLYLSSADGRCITPWEPDSAYREVVIYDPTNGSLSKGYYVFFYTSGKYIEIDSFDEYQPFIRNGETRDIHDDLRSLR